MQLYDYQLPSAAALETALRKHRVAVDASDCGVGKTPVACHVLSKMRLPALIVCPKGVITSWKRTLSAFGVAAEVINYEKLRTGNTPFGKWEGRRFAWSLPKDTVIVWDEFHRCKAPDTKNAKMVYAAKHNYHNMLLSATLAENPLEMRALGFLVNLHSWNDWWTFCKRNGCRQNPWGGMEFGLKHRDAVLGGIHKYLFNEWGFRIRISELGDLFPETQITAEAVDFSEDIQGVYTKMEEEVAKLGSENFSANALVAQLRARQEVELRKVSGLATMAQDAINEGMSVVIFTNFRESLDQLRAILKCDGVFGGQSEEERQRVVDEFQADQTRVVVCNIQAGGIGLSLHDVNGTYPRLALIMPCFDAKALKQVLGRVHRSGGKSKSIQKIIFASNSIEESICESVKSKLHNLDLVNDGILQGRMNETEFTMSDPAMDTIVAAEPFNIPEVVTVSETVILPPERGHAKYSPSSLRYRLTCAGWTGDNSPDRDLRAAERGTRGHEAWEKNAGHFIIDDPALREAVIKCSKYSQSIKGVSFREQRVAVLDQFGFFDQLVVQGAHAHLLDAKFSNNRHYADSPQFWAYCVGIWDDPKWAELETITVHVLLPFLGFIDKHVFRKSDYETLKLRVLSLIEAARVADPASFRPFHGCVYCGRAGRCPKLAEVGAELASRYGDQVAALPEGTLHGSEVTDPATMAALLDCAPIVEKAAEGWRRAAADMYQKDGTPIPGYELIQREGARKITNAKSAYDVYLERGGQPDQFAEIADVSLGKMEDLFATLAPKGKKGAYKQELNDLLTDREALALGQPSFYLKKQKQNKQ